MWKTLGICLIERYGYTLWEKSIAAKAALYKYRCFARFTFCRLKLSCLLLGYHNLEVFPFLLLGLYLLD